MIFSVEGVLEAFEFGATCLQSANIPDDIIGSEMFFPPSPLSEDCLTLNLWVPHPQQKRRSVMVCMPVSGPYPGGGGCLYPPPPGCQRKIHILSIEHPQKGEAAWNKL